MSKLRNNEVTGKNSASYDAKHPHNPITMRPIHDALCKVRHEWQRKALLLMCNGSRTDIAYGVKALDL